MNYFFLDASALAKRYSLEAGVDLLDYLFSKVPRDRLSCVLLGAAEVVSVLVRRRNGGLLSAVDFTQAMLNFTTEIVNATDFRTLALENGVILSAMAFIETHSINSNDAVVLRLALDIANHVRSTGDDVVLVASDRRLLRAAQAEGLATFDPETQSQADLDALLPP